MYTLATMLRDHATSSTASPSMTVLRRTRRKYQILDTLFRIDSSAEPWSRFFDRFSGAYEADTTLPPPASEIDLCIELVSETRLDRVLEGLGRGLSAFHSSKNYEHWSISGHGRAGAIALRQYGLGFEFRGGVLRAIVSRRSSQRAPELIFHAARSIALCLRSSPFDVMLHASAIVLPGGGAVLFAGGKGSGKSTLFAEMVIRGRCKPLANDRVFLTAGSADLWSWPSYLSYCEGTILDYPPLRTAFDAYEAEAQQHGCRIWGTAYRAIYSQTAKRIVPPYYLQSGVQSRYACHATASTLVIPYASTTLSAPFTVVRECDASELSLAQLKQFCFLGPDPDFPPWHGIPAGGVASVRRVSDEIRASGMRVVEIALNPMTGKQALRDLLFAHDHAAPEVAW